MYVRKTIWLSAVTIFTLILSACGASNNEAAIATSVAMTVQAQNSMATSTPATFPTSTLPAGVTPVPTLTNIVPTIGPASTGGSLSYECAKASLVSENYPDGTIITPKETFYKTWQIKNESNCTWSTSYKIVFWDGDMLGGAYYYNLPQSAGPGQTIDIPLQLIAPEEDGAYKSEWKLQTPDGINFGVGQYSEPFYADIVVSSETDPNYQITSVTYRIERVPEAGCATNVFYYVYAKVTVNGPLVVRMQWFHSDGYASRKVDLTFTEAGTQEIMDGWSFHLGSSPGDKWIQLWQVAPTKVEFDKATFSYLCQ